MEPNNFKIVYIVEIQTMYKYLTFEHATYKLNESNYGAVQILTVIYLHR